MIVDKHYINVTIFMEQELIVRSELIELMQLLLLYPDSIKRLQLSDVQLDTETSSMIGTFIASSKTVKWVSIAALQERREVYIPIAAALRVNQSIKHINIRSAHGVFNPDIRQAFANAIQANPHIRRDGYWNLHHDFTNFWTLV